MPNFFRRPGRIQKPTSQTVSQPYHPIALAQPRRGAPRVTAETMMSLPAFYAAMRVTAGMVASTPIVDDAGEIIDVMPATSSHWLARPTAHDTAYTYIDSLVWNMLVHANAFVVPTKVSMATGQIIQTEIIHPEYMVPLWNRSGTSAGFEQGAWLDGERLGPNDFMHFREVSIGGYARGPSKLKLLAHTIGIQLSERAHVKSTYDDGAQPTGYWNTDKPMNKQVADEWAKEISLQIGGRGNSSIVLPDGLKWESVVLNHEDIQLLASRQWSTAEASSIIGVPPHLIGAATYDSDTYANVRQDVAMFEALTLSRYKMVIEQTLSLHGCGIKFGESELSKPTKEDQIAGVVAAVGAGICSPAQAAEHLRWPAPEVVEAPAALPPGDGVTDADLETMIEVANADV